MIALSSFVNPLYGVIAYTFISIIRPEQLTWGNASINNVFALTIISLVVSSVVRNEKLLFAVKQPLFVCFILFTINFYLSTLTSRYTVFSDPRGSIYYLNQYPQILCFCICLYAVLSRLDSNQFQNYIIISISFITFMGLWGILQSSGGNVGVEGMFGYDRCAVTAVFVLYLPIAYYFVNNQKSLLKWFGVFSFFVCFTLIILTGSRAGFLGLGMAILHIFWYSRSKAKFLRWSILLLLLGLLITPEGYFERFDTMQTNDIAENEITDYSSASRLLMWKVALQMIADHPLMGVGNLNFSKANKEYAPAFKDTVDKRLYNATFGLDGEEGLSHTHNTFLNVLVEGGLITAVPFFLLFIIPLRKGWKLVSRYRGSNDSRLDLIMLINAGISGFLVTGFFGTLLQVDYFYWNLTILYFLVTSLEKSLLVAEGNNPTAIKGV